MSSSKNTAKEATTISQSTLFDLKGIVSEHRSTFDKEGRSAVKGRIRPKDEAMVSIFGILIDSKLTLVISQGTSSPVHRRELSNVWPWKLETT